MAKCATLSCSSVPTVTLPSAYLPDGTKVDLAMCAACYLEYQERARANVKAVTRARPASS